MDFSKLDPKDLQDFINQDYSQYGIYPGLEVDPIDRAESLFNQLKTIHNVSFPMPVIDLYLASSYTGPTDKNYLEDQILNLSSEDINTFAKIFQFDYQLFNDEINRNRILRILSHLDMVIQPRTEILTGAVMESVCKFLTFEEANKWRIVRGLERLECPIQITDPYIDMPPLELEDESIVESYHISELPYIDDDMVRVYQLIMKYGSEKSLREAAKRDLKAVKILLDLGVPICSDSHNRSPLDIAIDRRQVDIVELLLQRGADPNRSFYLGGMINVIPLNLAITSEYFRLKEEEGIDEDEEIYDSDEDDSDEDEDEDDSDVELFTEEQIRDILTLGEMQRLLQQADHGLIKQSTVHNKMIKLGIPILPQLPKDDLKAIRLSLINLLLKAGANPDPLEDFLADPNYITPLLEAILIEDLNVIGLLLDNGADINLINNNDISALFMAINHHRILAAKYLISRGADINLVGPGGRTPLTYAIHHENLEMIKTILEAGANPQEGLDYIHNSGFTYPEINKLLLRYLK